MISVVCYDCLTRNHRILSRVAGFTGELQASEFLSVSDAHKHMLEHPDHEMGFEEYVEQRDDPCYVRRID